MLKDERWTSLVKVVTSYHYRCLDSDGIGNPLTPNVRWKVGAASSIGTYDDSNMRG